MQSISITVPTRIDFPDDESMRIILLYKTELIHDEAPWRDEWVQWFNTKRTHGSINDLTPTELEQLAWTTNTFVDTPVRASTARS